MAEIIFVFSVVTVAACYVGYPAVLAVLSRLLGQASHKAGITPRVSLIIAA